MSTRRDMNITNEEVEALAEKLQGYFLNLLEINSRERLIRSIEGLLSRDNEDGDEVSIHYKWTASIGMIQCMVKDVREAKAAKKVKKVMPKKKVKK